jgi:hypothetical protein
MYQSEFCWSWRWSFPYNQHAPPNGLWLAKSGVGGM